MSEKEFLYQMSLKGRGRIYPQVACDCFSSFGAAKVYDNKTTKVSTDFVENHLAKKFAPVKKDRENPYRLWNRVYHLARGSNTKSVRLSVIRGEKKI